MSIISLRKVTKHFGKNSVIRDASFDIEAGRTYGLVGPNGSGKSVLLKLMCGFAIPSSGDIWVDPKYLSSNRSFPEHFGVAINGPAYLPHLTGRKNLLELAAITRRAGAAEVDSALGRVGLDLDVKQKVRDYSLGMKQKLSLAQALMEEPSVLILDEPFNALDASSATRLGSILREEQAKGTTIVYTSHHRADIDEHSDQLLEFDGGIVKTLSMD
ncbi:multidrug ABC transporter ATP-binding protein (plasmid) [Arthrobacter sp. ERGS1:01]|uniref:ABC transporter ATP-binding protein n=1 Tax=Arthrobacter sp. ERGS1:01 TaxID=1704044 RepID=UPI0006B466F7|nr:ABC transporter ATP-binding protein [Arthrobacter sp. ERGS1:01]ALE04759.1 multidrug ABC transporter ATP-binding protein [Arthrobacter sp. ERGS1:01]